MPIISKHLSIHPGHGYFYEPVPNVRSSAPLGPGDWVWQRPESIVRNGMDSIRDPVYMKRIDGIMVQATRPFDSSTDMSTRMRISHQLNIPRNSCQNETGANLRPIENGSIINIRPGPDGRPEIIPPTPPNHSPPNHSSPNYTSPNYTSPNHSSPNYTPPNHHSEHYHFMANPRDWFKDNIVSVLREGGPPLMQETTPYFLKGYIPQHFTNVKTARRHYDMASRFAATNAMEESAANAMFNNNNAARQRYRDAILPTY
jgi:hypothetical protein